MRENELTLAELRKQAGMTQLQVAEQMGVTKGRITQIEADYPELKYTVVMRYMKAIDAHVRVSVKGSTVDMNTVVANPERQTTAARRSRHKTLPPSYPSDPRHMEIPVGP